MPGAGPESGRGFRWEPIYGGVFFQIFRKTTPLGCRLSRNHRVSGQKTTIVGVVGVRPGKLAVTLNGEVSPKGQTSGGQRLQALQCGRRDSLTHPSGR